MIGLADVAALALALGVSIAPPPEPTPLSDAQREMLLTGIAEPGSFREPAFEALVENVRSWPAGAEPSDAVILNVERLETFKEFVDRDPGALIIATGEVMMIDPLGDSFPGAQRLTLKIGDRTTPKALLVFVVDQAAPVIGDDVRAVGRAYKVMALPTQRGQAPTPFPAMVGRFTAFTRPAPAPPAMTGAAIVTALTGALAVVFFVVIMGRHMLGKNRPHRRPRPPLASTGHPPDDASDA